MKSLVHETPPGKPGSGDRPQHVQGSPDRREWFTAVTTTVVDASQVALTDRGLRMVLILDGFCRDRAWCFPSLTRLATMTGRTVRWAQDTLRELEADGWIARVHGAQNQLLGIVMRRRTSDMAPAANTPARLARAIKEVQESRVPSTKNPSCSETPARRILHAQHEESCALSMKDSSSEEESDEPDAIQSSSSGTDDDPSSRSEEEQESARVIVDRLSRDLGPKLRAQIEPHGAELARLLNHNAAVLDLVLARLKTVREPVQDVLRYILVAALRELGTPDPQRRASEFAAGKRLTPYALAETKEHVRSAHQAETSSRAAALHEHSYSPEEIALVSLLRTLALTGRKLTLGSDGLIRCQTVSRPVRDVPVEDHERDEITAHRDAIVRLLALAGGSSVDATGHCPYPRLVARGGAA